MIIHFSFSLEFLTLGSQASDSFKCGRCCCGIWRHYGLSRYVCTSPILFGLPIGCALAVSFFPYVRRAREAPVRTNFVFWIDVTPTLNLLGGRRRLWNERMYSTSTVHKRPPIESCARDETACLGECTQVGPIEIVAAPVCDVAPLGALCVR